MTGSIAAWTVLVLGVSLMVTSGLEPVYANGATRPVVTNARVGPYMLQVGILPGKPKVGNLHLAIVVKDAEGGATITDATVTVAATGPEGATNVSPVQARNTPIIPQLYDVDISLDMEGSWTLTLEIDSRSGKAGLDVPLQVTASGGANLVIPIAGAVGFLALAVWVRGRLSRRGKRRKSTTQRNRK